MRWIRDRVRPRLRADGVVIAEGILADVTAEKEALLALEAARQEADRLARVDPLTGAFNRRHFSEALESELARAGRQGTGTGLLAVDIDHFKVLNDLHGHAVGDEVLVHVAGRIADALARLRHAGALGRRGVRGAAARVLRPRRPAVARASACARRSRTRPPYPRLRGFRSPSRSAPRRTIRATPIRPA